MAKAKAGKMGEEEKKQNLKKKQNAVEARAKAWRSKGGEDGGSKRKAARAALAAAKLRR